MTHIKLLHSKTPILYASKYLTEGLTSALVKELSNQKWSQGSYKMYGNVVKSPRLLSSMFDSDDLDLYKNGHPNWGENLDWINNGTKGWTPLMKHIKESIESTFKVKISYAQMNHYRNENDHIGWHSDNEMGVGDQVFSISLGATRRFSFREKSLTSGSSEVDLMLSNGDMDYENGKDKYKHCIQKVLKRDNYVDPTGFGRINITFRTIT
jgi:alkylated DNA repair dioxygenase AlkB